MGNQGRGGSGRNNAQWLCAAFDDACTCTEACAIGSTIGYYARVVKCQNEDNPGACQADRPSRTSMGASSGELDAEGKSKSCPCTNCTAAVGVFVLACSDATIILWEPATICFQLAQKRP